MTAAIILAGAHVWSNDDLGALVPRLLLPVAHVRLVDYLLDWLRGSPVRHVVFCINNADSRLWEHLGAGASSGLQFYYCVDREPRGPAGCCRDATLLVAAQRYVVVDGSVLPDFPLSAVLEQHEQASACATLVVARDESGEDGREPHPVGVYIFEARALAGVAPAGFHDIKEGLLPQLHKAGELVQTCVVHGASPRLLGLEAYFAVQNWLLNRMQDAGSAPPGYVRRDGVLRHETAQWSPAAESIGPVLVGPRSRVAAGATLIGPVVLGSSSLIDADACVQRSILWDECLVAREARVDRCLLMSGSRVARGSAVTGVVSCGELVR